MEILTLASLAELKAYLGSIDRPMLFRGQTRHFGGTRSPAIMSSFDRHGCIPEQMLKWAYYARGALKSALGHTERSVQMSQAILQHYGWRSFFLDASSSAHVAAWFAAHRYQSRIAVHMSEDCFEDPMLLRKPEASYEPSTGSGHLYLIDIEATARAGTGLHDLTTIDSGDAQPRFLAQSAWLLGPQRTALPIECFHSRVIAPCGVLAAFAAEGGLSDTATLFPGPSKDRVLRALLDLPWTEMEFGEAPSEKEGSIPAFMRTIEIPEYEDGFVKRYGPEHAFYRGAMLADLDDADGAPPPFVFREVPEAVVFGHADPVADRFPRLAELLLNEASIAFEIRQLVRFPETGPSATYGKGLVVQRDGDGIVSVADLVIDHPGMLVTGAGGNFGWHYRIDPDGRWIRHPHSDDCACGDDDRHLRHLSALTILETWLADPEAFEDDQSIVR